MRAYADLFRMIALSAQVDPQALMAVQSRISLQVETKFGVNDKQVMAAVEKFNRSTAKLAAPEAAAAQKRGRRARRRLGAHALGRPCARGISRRTSMRWRKMRSRCS